jgi:hypothetical protein
MPIKTAILRVFEANEGKSLSNLQVQESPLIKGIYKPGSVAVALSRMYFRKELGHLPVLGPLRYYLRRSNPSFSIGRFLQEHPRTHQEILMEVLPATGCSPGYVTSRIAARARGPGPPAAMDTTTQKWYLTWCTVPEPLEKEDDAAWAAYFARNPLETWQDIGDALGYSAVEAEALANKYVQKSPYTIPKRVAR